MLALKAFTFNFLAIKGVKKKAGHRGVILISKIKIHTLIDMMGIRYVT